MFAPPRLHVRPWLWGLGSALVITACSSGSDTASNPSDAGTIAQTGDICTAARAFAVAACERAARCGTRNYADANMCADYVAAAMLPDLIDAKSSDVSAGAAEARTAACDAEAKCGSAGAVLAAGAACIGPEECVPGLTCSDKHCEARRAQGAACADSDDCRVGLSCQSGRCDAVVENVTHCTLSGHCETLRFDELALSNLSPMRCDLATSTCQRVTATRALGQACGYIQHCGAGLYCKRGVGAATSACAPVQAYGDACTINEDGCPACQGGNCTDPLAALCK